MGVLSQSELCPCPPLEKDRLEDVAKCHPSPEKERSQSLHCTEGDSLLSEGGSSPGSNSSDGTEEDEASSTESTQNGHESPCTGRSRRPVRVEEPQKHQVLNKISALENRIKELHHRKKELNIEMDLEGALLEGELKEERQALRWEEERLLELQRRLGETERRCHAEKEKEKVRLQKERRRVEELQRQHAESQIHLDNQPESLRERMQSQLQETSEMLDGALRSYEDLEFQHLERESRLEEEKEAACQALTQEITQLQNNINKRKRTVQKLEGQARLTQEQMVGECQRFAQEKGEAVRNLNVEKNRLMDMGQEYLEENGVGSSGDKQGVTQLTFTQKTDRKVIMLGADQSDSSSCVFSVRSSVKGSIGLQRTASLPRRRGDRLPSRTAQRPISLHGALDPSVLAAQLSGGNNGHYLGSPNLHFSRLNNPLYQLLGGQGAVGQLGGSAQGAYSLGNCVTQLAEMEKRVREAMAERERLLQEREAKRAAEEARRMELPSSTKNSSPVEIQEPKPAVSDLRKHLEASGHSVDTCSQVRVTSKSCKGYLVKMGGRIKTWKKRWFTFDRQKRVLAYYADKEETKLKGVIYFQAIEEVYYDHLRSAFKSPSPKLTFCVKTYDRLFCMVAPSPEAMRIWMDAIVTAAEENARY
ncbi:pleckstrin homology-like domain family B member 3 isoform X2 [Hemicordylus capensis]|uniref:pleckstrin homology-like domain family B member 3 isoform X2 n=1 Tax=Hemicordylus capensis TaxID=884348 RepID=UPI002304867E|nr:pleckstrin homology-like domain family B member 3 isoform X2 [Hemicordylus capensis]